MEHLLNSCIFTSKLLDIFATIFKQSNKDKEGISDTINNWRNNFSDYEVLNLA